MRKSRRNGGFTLIEMMCALLILVLLVMGMGVGMDTGSKIYRDATFESESATLSGILNTSIGDILRYSIDIREVKPAEFAEHGSDVGIPHLDQDAYGNDRIDTTKRYVFTSLDYGIQDAFFYIPPSELGQDVGPVKMKNLRNATVVELVNTGAYPNLAVSNFTIAFRPRIAPGIEGGYFKITYTIKSTTDATKVRNVETIVRVMND